jgi:hypothetical protein
MNKGSALGCLVSIFLAAAILVVLILDLGGWGTFALDIAKSVAVQFLVAAILTGIVWAILHAVDEAWDFSLPGVVVRFLSSFAPVLALVALPLVFKRPVDVYDAVQTVVLVVLFFHLGDEYEGPTVRRPRRASASRPHGPALPPRAPVSRPPPLPPRPRASREGVLYQKLLTKALGDAEKVERLVDYERGRAPHASRKELLERALERWERDSR